MADQLYLTDMYSPAQIANYFISKAIAEKIQLTPMKLQKLVFFAHGWYLGYEGKPLLNEQVEAWKFGPVVESLYHAVKGYGNSPVTSMITELDYASYEITTPAIASADPINDFLESIWNAYKSFTGVELSNITHLDGSPWHQVITKNKVLRKNTDIPDDIIADYFKAQIAKAQNGGKAVE